MFGSRTVSSRGRRFQEWRARALACAGLVGAGLLATPAEAPACGGTPPPFFCAKTYVLAKGVANPNLAAAAGGVVTVDTLHFVDLIEFGGFCPPGLPATVSMTATLDCEPPPDAGPFNFGPFPIEEGFTEIPIDIPVPAGPPRVCQVVVTSTVTFADGTQIAQTADQQACLLPSAPDDPDKPVLQVELVGESVSCGHAGDEQGFCFEVTNCSDDIFDGTFSVTMQNVADLPEVVSGPNDTASGVWALSDPGGGDSYPMTASDPNCVTLPAEPHTSTPEALTGSVVLLPGEMAEIKIDARTWQLCANGSCGEGVFQVTGFLAGEAVTACAGFAMATDNAKPPDFACDDAGRAVTQTSPGAGAAGPSAVLITEPDPDDGTTVPVQFILDISKMQLLINGEPITSGTPSFSGVTQVDGGFIRNVAEFSFIQPQAQPEDTITMINEFIVDVPSVPGEFIEIQELSLASGAPNGFESFSPFAVGCFLIDVPGVEPYLLDAMHQVFAVGVEEGTFDQVPMTNLDVQYEQMAPDRYLVTSTWQATNPDDVDAPMIGFDVQNDYRGYARPEPAKEPCIADCNGDGEINILDFICFQANFEADDLETADCNDDGELNILDFICFQTEFEAALKNGCP